MKAIFRSWLFLPILLAVHLPIQAEEPPPAPPGAVEAEAVEVEPAIPAGSEYIVVCGGPALIRWERTKRRPHDNIWANFINAAEIRWRQIKAKARPGDQLTWLIHRGGYERRGKEDGQNLIAAIEARARALGVDVKWFNGGGELIEYINGGYPRDSVKIANFDYFGHSNRNCWMFDYSNAIDGCSEDFLHNNDLPRIRKGSFLANAHAKSWGCHSAESFTYEWQRATGTRMIGTVGKTDYSTGGLPVVTRAKGWSS